MSKKDELEASGNGISMVNDKEKKLIKKQERKIFNRNTLIKIMGVIIVILLILLFLKSCCGVDVVSDIGNRFNVDPNAVVGGIDSRPREEIEADMNAKVSAGMINISMNSEPVFESGAVVGNLMIVNEEINNYGQVVEIFRDDTGENIYTSGVIPIGSRVEKAELSVNLPKGDYKCTAYFSAVTEDGQYMGKAGRNIIIKILN